MEKDGLAKSSDTSIEKEGFISPLCLKMEFQINLYLMIT